MYFAMQSYMRLRLTAFFEWLLILPATLFLAVAALRTMQPPEREPARTLGVLVEWTGAHISRSAAALIFLALPAAVSVIGGMTLRRAWRDDAALRRDALALRRHAAVILLATATILATAIVALVLGHVITD